MKCNIAMPEITLGNKAIRAVCLTGDSAAIGQHAQEEKERRGGKLNEKRKIRTGGTKRGDKLLSNSKNLSREVLAFPSHVGWNSNQFYLK